MGGSEEIELKLAASPAMLRQLRDHPLLAGDGRELTLATCYFDTAAASLHAGGATLRVRSGGSQDEQTFKFAGKSGAGVRRGEWNVPVGGPVPEVAAFPPDVRRRIEALIGEEALLPRAVTRIERTTRRLRFGRSAIELAFDAGTIEAGDRSEPVCELEMELIEGDAADLFALAGELPLGPELAWSAQSKGARGQALAFDLPFAAVRAAEAPLSPRMGVSEGFRAIAWSCLGQLLGNCGEVVRSGDPDAIHQSRVAIRRLRAAFSLFGHSVADARSPIFRAEWNATAASLGPARDLHVLIERVEAAVAESGADADELLQRLRGQRAAATRAAQAALAGTAFQHLLVRFAEWLERGMPEAEEPLTAFAGDVLGRRRRKLAKARPLTALPDDDLHDLRIKGKKLRYAAEFFAALYPDEKSAKARRQFGKALGKLQDHLGSVHDLAVAHDQRETLFAELEPITAAGLSAQLAELLDNHGPSRKQLVRRAGRALDRVADAPAWWTLPAGGETPATD
jgi:triphosphatase